MKFGFFNYTKRSSKHVTDFDFEKNRTALYRFTLNNMQLMRAYSGLYDVTRSLSLFLLHNYSFYDTRFNIQNYMDTLNLTQWYMYRIFSVYSDI